MRKLALSGILISMAIVLSYVERLFPLGLIVPLPGIKLGLANIVTVFALFYLGFKPAFIITILRCILTALLFGSISSLLFSLFGAFAALLAMVILKRGYGKLFSIIGVSMGGAAAHNIGQIMAASLLLKSLAVFAYLPLLLVASIFTGILTAVAAGVLFNRLDILYPSGWNYVRTINEKRESRGGLRES
jgi:heptaprenyl diphosphate synthase